MIRYFEHPAGNYIEKIIGQDRLAYAHSDTNDFYDMIEWSKKGGYQGSVIIFYDFDNGKVYKPFEKKQNVLYSNPVFADGYYYFLQGNYNDKLITLYRFLPEEEPDIVTTLGIDDVDLYNLRIVGSPVWIVSQNEQFESYYPKRFSFELTPEEDVVFIDDNKVYIEKWVEEGWDDVNDCATNEYKYYHKIIVKDHSGNIISEEIGSLYQAPDGTWWVS